MSFDLAPTGLLADPATYPSESSRGVQPAFLFLEPTALPADPATYGWVLALTVSIMSLMDEGAFWDPPRPAFADPLES